MGEGRAHPALAAHTGSRRRGLLLRRPTGGATSPISMVVVARDGRGCARRPVSRGRSNLRISPPTRCTLSAIIRVQCNGGPCALSDRPPASPQQTH